MTFIIAEAGVNHGGRWETGLDLIDAAKSAGADAVKFQAFSSARLWGDERIKDLELSEDALLAMKAHCDEVGIEFMCTPFGVREVEFLAPLVRRMKIASGCLDKRHLLDAVRATNLPVIMSTGMSDLQRIGRAARVFGSRGITLLHCTSSYPCRLEDVNLLAMQSLGKPYGYSDHTDGIIVPIMAVALGAVVIEKHLTLDRFAQGPDHLTSIEPHEFGLMVESIRAAEKALGCGVKAVQPCEVNLQKAWA